MVTNKKSDRVVISSVQCCVWSTSGRLGVRRFGHAVADWMNARSRAAAMLAEKASGRSDSARYK